MEFNWKGRVLLMTTIPELIRIYIKGFKQLFYHKGVEGERKKLSLLKIILFLLSLSAYLFAFLQFTPPCIITVQGNN